MALRDGLRLLRTLAKREWRYWRRTLLSCTLQPTYRCNLRCKMCGAPSLSTPDDPARELSGEEMLRIVDQLKQMGAAHLQLIGGEPFLRKDEMLAVTQHAARLGLKTALVTNGTLINQDLAREILDAGLRKLVFSVDGVNGAHDRIRGPGVFESMQRGMRFVLEERRRRRSRHPLVHIQSVVSRLNYDQVHPLIRFKEEIGADVLDFNYLTELSGETVQATRLDDVPLCTDRWARKGDSLLLTPAELADLRAALARCPDSETLQILKDHDDDAYLQCHHPPRRCYYIRNVMVINPFGDVYPCVQLDRYVTGNVRQSGLKAVWQNERHRKAVAALRRGMFPACSGCHFFSYNLSPWEVLRFHFRR